MLPCTLKRIQKRSCSYQLQHFIYTAISLLPDFIRNRAGFNNDFRRASLLQKLRPLLISSGRYHFDPVISGDGCGCCIPKQMGIVSMLDFPNVVLEV